MVIIHPDEWASTAASAKLECPADAIKADTEPDLEKWLALNTQYAPALAQHH